MQTALVASFVKCDMMNDVQTLIPVRLYIWTNIIQHFFKFATVGTDLIIRGRSKADAEMADPIRMVPVELQAGGNVLGI